MTSDDRSILFILGGARSGTTYVNGLVDEWFDFGMGPEGAFVARFYARLARYGDLSDDAALARLIDDVSRCDMLEIMRSKWGLDKRADVTPAMIREAVTERSFAGVIYAVFTCVAAVQGKTRIGNKWPEYWRHLPMLDEMFGARARYLFVLRDGRDVALSTMKVPWGEKTSYACARSWVACVEAVEQFERDNPDARVMTLRYEDVLADPASAWNALEAFLDCTPDPERAAAFVRSIENNPMRNNSSKWRRAMTPRDQRIFEGVAGPHLAAAGYDLVQDAPAVSGLQHAYYSAAEFARKVYWTLRSRLPGGA